MEIDMSELEHYDREIYELDERIGRLALICGADLSRSEVVEALIKGRFEVCTHSGDLSKVRLEELRGLLMLKYKIEASCADSLSVAQFDRLITEQDARLRKRGFPSQSLADTDDV
jgi:hypothetical protein